jgi:hypothetical protein
MVYVQLRDIVAYRLYNLVMDRNTLQQTISIFNHAIRVTSQQWAHITEAHDYMSGNLDMVLETVSEPEQVIEGKAGASIALRSYAKTNISQKTAVVIYRDEPDGFVITAFLTSKPDKITRQGHNLWPT